MVPVKFSNPGDLKKFSTFRSEVHQPLLPLFTSPRDLKHFKISLLNCITTSGIEVLQPPDEMHPYPELTQN